MSKSGPWGCKVSDVTHTFTFFFNYSSLVSPLWYFRFIVGSADKSYLYVIGPWVY